MRFFLLTAVCICLLLVAPLKTGCLAGQQAPEIKVAMLAALDFLERCDQGDYSGAWEMTAQLFRTESEQQDWLQQISHMRRRYGDFQQRRLQFSKPLADQQADGQATLLLFRTWFEQKTAAELLTMVKDDKQQWRVAGYTIE